MKSHYDITGNGCRTINVFFVVDEKPLNLTFKHSTNLHKTCKEARIAAAKKYGLSESRLRAYFDYSYRGIKL
jgi:hypothetical protein